MAVTRLRSLVTLLTFTLVPTAIPGDAGEERPSQLSILLGSEDDSGYERALEPRDFVFPDDHGPHPAFRNEWWYVTGNLDAEGRRFGFELTFFRFALSPGDPASDSNWRTRQVYIAHFAVTDADRERFLVAERYSRGALGLAGARSEPFRVWLDDWEIAAADAGANMRWRLQAADTAFALDLDLTALKPPVLNGKRGLSQKSDEPGNASYYYSMTRWQSAGTLRIDDTVYPVTGLSWLDREWSSSALAANQRGWDWFALQLSDGTELMFYSIRRDGGQQDPNSAGTWVGGDGRTRHIRRDAIEISVTDTWESPQGGTYPSGWALHLPELELALTVRPVMDDQELFTTVRYWEGAVDVSGTRAGESVNGRGYVELTGYAE